MIAIVRREFVRSRNDHRNGRKDGGDMENLSVRAVPLINFDSLPPATHLEAGQGELHG